MKEKLSKLYMEDGSLIWLSPTDFNIVKNLHPAIKITIEPKNSIVLLKR